MGAGLRAMKRGFMCTLEGFRAMKCGFMCTLEGFRGANFSLPHGRQPFMAR